jgi:hypothetical protein
MAIEFRCTQCGQQLRVPDESAGRTARCPKCSSLMTIPAGGSAAPLPSAASPPFADIPPSPYPSSPYPSSPYPPPPKPADSPFAATPHSASVNPYASSPLPAGYGPANSQSQTPMMLAVGSLATAVAGLLSCACCLFIPFPPISLILGIIALNQQPNPQARTIAITGIALSVLSLILFAVGMIIGLAGMALDPQFQQGLGK